MVNYLSSYKAPNKSEILFYQIEDGSSRIQVRLDDKTVWLTQAQMVELFQTAKQNVSLHIQNIFKDQELNENSVVKEYLTIAADGKQYSVKFYSLDVIIALGYRVKSHRGAQFRRWATERLREYLIKGFVLDDERLKNPKEFGADYFDELLARIRDIIVVMFIDQAEFRAQRRQDIKMQDWTAFLDKFLLDTELPVLTDAGSVSHEDALLWANKQYDAFTERRRLEAETAAEGHYLDNLRTSAKTLETGRKKPSHAKRLQKNNARRMTKTETLKQPSRYRPYPEYKNSGVEWLGNVPVHWHTKPLKRICVILSGSTPKSGEPDYWNGDIT